MVTRERERERERDRERGSERGRERERVVIERENVKAKNFHTVNVN